MVSSSSGHTIEHYKLIRQLGDGQFGAGYLAQDTSNNNKCCVKVFKNMDESTEKTFKAEIMAGQSGLNHENIIKLLGAGRSQICKNGKASKTDSYYIVSELCSNGEAFDFVQDAGGLKDHYARTMFKQLCSAVKFVHDKNIAHRDLKLENCFLDKNVVLKLADFGLAKFYAGASGSKLSTECGTPQYMAPEIGEGQYDGPPVDIFAMGVILFIMCNAKFPFGKALDKHYCAFQQSPQDAMNKRKISCDDALLDLIQGMTAEGVNDRLDINQVINHPWMKEETASQSQLAGLFSELTANSKQAAKEASSRGSNARKSAANNSGTHRGMEAWGIEQDACDELECYDFEEEEEYNLRNAFFSEGHPQLIAESIGKFIKDKDSEAELEMDDQQWKLKFKVKGVDFDGEEDENEAIEVHTKFHASKGKANDPDEVFVQFIKKSGNQVTFAGFMKEMMAEENGVNIWPIEK